MILDPIRLVVGGAFLLYAAILDVRTRRVPNRVWLVMGALGLILIHIHLLLEGCWYHHFIFLPLFTLYTFPFIELEEKPDLKDGIITPGMWYFQIICGLVGIAALVHYGGSGFMTMTLIGTSVFILLIFVMYFTGLIFGGADAKGMMAVTLFVPFHPSISFFPIYETDIQAIDLVFTFPVVVLTISVIVFAFMPVALGGLNLFRKDIGYPMFFGYKLPLDEIPGKHIWLMERPVMKNGELDRLAGLKIVTFVGEAGGISDWLQGSIRYDGIRIEVFPKKSSAGKLNDELAALERMGKERVWVTPKIPFMVAVLFGYVLAFLFGNVLFMIMDLVLG